MFICDGKLFYNAETYIEDAIKDLKLVNNTVKSFENIDMKSYKYMNDVNNLLDDIGDVKAKIEELLILIEAAKIRLKKLDSDFAVDYNQAVIQNKDFFIFDGGNFKQELYNKYDIQKYIDYYIKNNPELKSVVEQEIALEKYLELKLENIGEWYIDNVKTYQNSTSGSATGTRAYYQTPFGTRKFGDDCTEFVAAYMSYVCGKDVTETYTGNMVYPNSDWAKEVEKLGWKSYSSDEIDKLKMGDVLVSHKGALYSVMGEHAEIYINDNETFGWGNIKSLYPSKKNIKTEMIDGHVHFIDENHDYITIYRYEGDINNSQLEK